MAGGLTNTVAVWMLFHPYKSPRLGRFQLRFLHGAIPKNQARLAEAVGRTVRNQLLTQEDLTVILANQEFRRAFEVRLEQLLVGLLETERGSLREILSPDIALEIGQLLEEAADLLEARLEGWLESPQFEELVEARVTEFLNQVSEHSVSDVLTPTGEETIAVVIAEWARKLVEQEGFRDTIEDYIDRTFDSFLKEDRTLEEVLPEGLVGSLERALSGYLPIAVRKLGGILEDPNARNRLESTVHDLFQRFLRDLRFHQRIVAQLVVTEETLDRVLKALEEEGAEHLSEILRDPTVQDATAQKVNDAVVDFLQRPVTSILGRPGDESVDRARETVVEWIVGMTRDPGTFEFLLERIRQGIDGASESTWGKLLNRIPPDQLSLTAVSVARSRPARSAYRGALGRVLRSFLDRPIGRPGNRISEGSAARIQRAFSDPLWEWLQTQIPEVVKTLDIGRRVEDKVRVYPTSKMEELVRKVTDRELRMIVRLGYVLGGVIGLILVVLDALLG